MKIPITRVYTGEREAELLKEPLERGWLVQGPMVERFERAFAAYTGAPHAIATTSCTTALHLGLVAQGVTPGSEVLVPALTWVATANVVEYIGAKPVFVDIDLATFNIDSAKARAALTSKTKACIPVHLFGLPVSSEFITELRQTHNLQIVEDAACGFGARIDGAHVGLAGHTGCFSFHPRKAITTGEGGMIITKDAALAAQCRSLRDHGATISDLQRHQGPKAYLLPEFPEVGFNYRMTDLQGAVGVAQMERAEWIQTERAARARRYHELLGHLSWLRLPVAPSGVTHGFQAYVCLFAPEEPTLNNVEKLTAKRNILMDHLEAQGISTRQGTHAPPFLGYYATTYGYTAKDFPNAYLAERLSITLPLFPTLSEEEQQRVVREVEVGAKKAL